MGAGAWLMDVTLIRGASFAAGSAIWWYTGRSNTMDRTLEAAQRPWKHSTESNTGVLRGDRQIKTLMTLQLALMMCLHKHKLAFTVDNIAAPTLNQLCKSVRQLVFGW